MINLHNNLLFINADDFGYDASVNHAIYNSFRRGLIHRTSMLVNMPGFEDAARIAASDKLFAGNIGLHFNLTEGFPLTEPIRSCRRFCDETGNYIYKREQPVFSFSGKEKNAIKQEMNAQIAKMTDAGIKPSHIDSHHHIHTEWPVLRIAVGIANDFGIQKIRLARNMGNQKNILKKQYRNFLNNYLKYIARKAGSDYFGDIDDFVSSPRIKDKNKRRMEIMVHPKMNAGQEIIDYNGKSLEVMLLSIIPELNINL